MTRNWVWCVVGAVGGAVVGFGAYALTHRDNFDWGHAALWTGAGALVGLTLGAGAEIAAGMIAANTAVVAGTGTAGTIGIAASPAGQVAGQKFLQSPLSRFPIHAYTHLIRITSGTGLQVHHIIEARFAKALGLDPNWILSVALTPAQHQMFTNAWRNYIPYGTTNVTSDQVWAAAQQVYAQAPELLQAVWQMLFRTP